MVSCKSPTGENQVNYVIHVEDETEVEQQLNDTFRIDINNIEVIYDFFPETYTVECKATLTFVMRQGQRLPIIHLDPATRNRNSVMAIRLDNEDLTVFNEANVKILTYTNSAQPALEFQRELAENIQHTLEIEYVLQLPQGYPRFSTEVNDIEGRGNEELFPTLNTPYEMSRHHITFRVHSNRAFRCIGSGLVEAQAPPPDQEDIQQWTLDTERDVASFSVLFVLLPEEDTVFETRRINNIDVRIMAFRGGASIDSAFSELVSWLPELSGNFGDFPMPRGLSIFLTSTGGGMEYFGGTISSLSVLRHEVFHMYFACSTVNKTFRDLWMDEAIDMWYSYSADPEYRPISDDYRSNIVSGRSAVAVGFDRRAYAEGAQIIQAAALRLGGRQEMIGFLSYLYRNYAFAPYTTLRFLDYLRDYSGVNMREEFQRWLYSDEQPAAAGASATRFNGMIEQEKVDLTPPRYLLRKYGIRE